MSRHDLSPRYPFGPPVTRGERFEHWLGGIAGQLVSRVRMLSCRIGHHNWGWMFWPEPHQTCKQCGAERYYRKGTGDE